MCSEELKEDPVWEKVLCPHGTAFADDWRYTFMATFSIFVLQKTAKANFFFISWGRGFSSASTLCKRPWKEELSKLFHGGKSSFFAEDQ